LLFRPIAGCETSSLRALNVGAIALICLVAYHLRAHLSKPNPNDADTQSRSTKQPQTSQKDWTPILHAHSALNIALFPPLFFFSALYYTDVMSTLAVLLSYQAFLTREHTQNRLLHSLMIVVVGVFALLFRQTNIFWVAVFPAGLAVVDVLADKQGKTSQVSGNVQSITKDAWSYGKVYDVPVGDAGLQGMNPMLNWTRELTNSRLCPVPSYCCPCRFEESIADSTGCCSIYCYTGRLHRIRCVEWWSCSR
jgi:alpha-1,2-glucosyltransferase